MKIKSNDYILAVIVAALGYFVDIYDLLLFSIVRVQSLKDLGFSGEDLTDKGVLLINTQMAGLLLGGIIWGVLGDKKGRLSVLFGSIVLYSAANFANGFVNSVETYAICRFIAGIGLAGELGAGITLVCELMPQRLRGYGTAIVAGVGVLGAVLAALIGDLVPWRHAYMIGGGMGFALLALRVGVRESQMFNTISHSSVVKGSFFSIFKTKESLKKYVAVILVGVPIWFTIGVLITFAPEFGQAMGMVTLPEAGKAVMFSYLGISLGDFLSGFASQKLGGRKKVIVIALSLLSALIAIHVSLRNPALEVFYLMTGLLGFAAGYWALFVTVAAEQFGTNIRATVTTTVPNFVRGAVIPLTFMFQVFKPLGVIQSGAIVGAITMLISFLALRGLEETYHKDLNYVEQH